MKALVVGGGSIGSRHLKNLRALGIDALGLVEVNEQRRKAVGRDCLAVEFSSLEKGLDWNPEIAVLATPPHLHAQQALQVAQRGIDLFIEKPLCHDEEGMEELAHLVNEKDLVSLVGCNMRFHPGPLKVKGLIGAEKLGKLLFVRIWSGSYLPDWRAGTDYSQNYAAKAQTGGGCLLDCVHEIDLARWYLGDVREVFCCAVRLSSLEIETEDVAALTCTHASGAISEIHLDYVQRSYERGCQVVGERGTVSWDFRSAEVRWYDAESGAWTNFTQSADWLLNQMYLDEMAHFLDCVRERKPTILPVDDAAEVMRVVFAAKKSAVQRKVVATGVEVFA